MLKMVIIFLRCHKTTDAKIKKIFLLYLGKKENNFFFCFSLNSFISDKFGVQVTMFFYLLLSVVVAVVVVELCLMPTIDAWIARRMLMSMWECSTCCLPVCSLQNCSNLGRVLIQWECDAHYLHVHPCTQGWVGVRNCMNIC